MLPIARATDFCAKGHQLIVAQYSHVDQRLERRQGGLRTAVSNMWGTFGITVNTQKKKMLGI